MADWLPEELKNDPVVKDIPDLPTLVKNYKEAQSYMGQSVRIPGENAGEADVKAFHEKLRTKVPDLILAKDEKSVAKAFGVPENLEEYVIPDEAKFSEEETQAFRARAKDLGLSKKQAELALQAELKQRTNAVTAVNENLAAIEKEWGAATKDRIEKIATVAERFGFDKDWVSGIRAGKVPLNALAPFQKMVDALGNEGNNLGKNSSSTT